MKRRRPGYTLVELLLVIVITAVLLSGLGVSFHITSLSIRGVQTAGRGDVELHRLAMQLRSDLHVAVAAEFVGGATQAEQSAEIGAGLDIRLPEETSIQYRSTRSGLTRELRVGDQLQQREVFRIDGLESMKWVFDRDREKPLLELTVLRRRREGSQIDPVDAVVILAAMNLRPQVASPAVPGGH
jgi:prepilin-type N-terminal cleavage/methylation domain-containing protein